MQYILFKPTESMLRDAGFQSIAHVPAIFSEEWDYHREANYWLWDRATGNDLPYDDGGGQIPTRQSMVTLARALIDFLAWCEWAMPRPKDLDKGESYHPWKHVDYNGDLIQRYQKSMLNGSWSASNAPLSPSTINTRVEVAARFCKWAVRAGFREKPFEIPYNVSYRKSGGLNSRSHERVAKKIRMGRVRSAPRDLSLPTQQQMEAWLHAVKIKKGPTIALMCRLATEVGLRREECVQWDLEYMSGEPSKWVVKFGYVSVVIRYGTKGPDYADMDTTEEGNTKYLRTIGPERTVDVPLELAMDLLEYRNKTRLKLVTKYINQAKNNEEKDRRRREVKTWHRLFLSEYDCRPIQGFTLAKAFKVNPPYPEWSTHLGRHYYACLYMLRSMQQDWNIETGAEDQGKSRSKPPPDWVLFKGQAALLMLKRRLGHLSEKTSQVYLVWLIEAFGYGNNDYISALEGAEAKSEEGESWQTRGV